MDLFIKQSFVNFCEETFNDIFCFDDIEIDDEIAHQCDWEQNKMTTTTNTNSIVEIFVR
jgi:hypothetical protein